MAFKYIPVNKRRPVSLSESSEDEDILFQKCDDQKTFAEKVQSFKNKKENDDSDYSDHEDEISSEEFLSKVTTVLRKEYGSKLQNKLSEVSKPVDDETALKTFNEVLENDDFGHEQEVKSEQHHDVVACATCSRKKRVESTTYFQKGQHIRMPGQHLTFTMFKKQVRVYSHHAIIKEVKGSCLNEAELVLIHFQKVDDKIKIYESTEIIDLNKDDIDIIEYQRPRHNPEEIVRRAESMLPKDNEDQNEFGKYYLFFQNCEHFATWCVVGESESFQVQGFFRSVGKWFSNVTGTGAAVGRFVARILMNSTDEIATGFKAGLHLPGVFLGATALLYLVYCIGETILSVQKKNKSLCNTCFKNKMTKLWAQCASFLTTSGLSYILVHFAVPSLIVIPGYGIPIMIVLVILSLALQWGISQLIDYLKSPFICEKKQVLKISEIEVGDVLEVKYWGLKHAVVVTEVHNTVYDETQGRIRCVHYGIPNGKIYGTRQIVEEYLIVDTKKEKIVKLDDSVLKTYTANKVVERARLRIGETKWNPLTNRSEHLAFFAKVKEDDTKSESSLPDAKSDAIGQSSSKHTSSLFVGESEVHQRDQIQPGLIIKLNDRTCMVLEVSDEDSNKRCFEIEILLYKNFFSSTSTISVNLDNDRIFIQKYLETRCYSMRERVQRARKEIGKRRFFLTKAGFFESIVENNSQVEEK